MTAERRRLLTYVPHLARCSTEASSYGKCVSVRAEKIQHNECSAEFNSLLSCFHSKSAKMKVKRLKRVRRIMSFFHYNHGYNEPYKLMLDGTICQAALQHKINLAEQLPKYLSTHVEICTTNCVLEELKLLGKELYGALRICEQYTVARCPHKPPRTAAGCLEHLARRSKNPNREKYIYASQDEQLLFNMRDMGGIALLSIRNNILKMEKPSRASINIEETKQTPEMTTITELKAQILGDQALAELPKKRKRKAKGPNPLSCKKKKKKTPAST